MLRGSEALKVAIHVMTAYRGRVNRARLTAANPVVRAAWAEQIDALDLNVAGLVSELAQVEAGMLVEAVYDAPCLPDTTASPN